MSNDKLYTAQFSRIEIEWLQRHILSGKDKTEGAIEKIKSPSGKVLTPEQNTELTQLVNYRDDLEKLATRLGDTLAHHDKQTLQLVAIRQELQEALELCDEPEARDAARAELKGLPDNTAINISFDRATLKYTLKLIENDLQKFRASIIPNYEKSKPEEYTDPIRTKSYFVNKARKAKNILERMYNKLEKGL